MTVPLWDSENRRAELDPSEIYNVLRNDRRRRTLQYLRDAGGEIAVDSLTEQIAADETGESPPPSDARKSVYVSLHQTHLPKLDDLGIVKYDERSKQLTRQHRAREVEAYMEMVPEHGVPWATYYLGIGVLAFLTLLAAKFGLSLFASLGFEFWGWFFVVFFVLSALYHRHRRSDGRRFG